MPRYVGFLCGLLITSGAMGFSPSQQILCKLEEASTQLGVTVLLGQPDGDTWGAVDYQLNFDERRLIRYMDLLIHEYCKYPETYLVRSGVETIVLTTDLKYKDQPRAAIPDPYKKQLFLSVNGAYVLPSERYLRHVLHHELQHCAEFMLWRSMTYDWPEWSDLNDTTFCYGEGGETIYRSGQVRSQDYYSASNPIPGFINLYSLTGDEEDRAEVLAYLMTDEERPMLMTLLTKDTILVSKIQLLQNLLNQHTGHQLVLPGTIPGTPGAETYVR